jgi:predicted MFS family arabinose efflux permease
VFDELASGVASVAAPDIERSLGASHALTAAVLFLVPGIAAFAIEPWLFTLADRHPRGWFVRGGLAAMTTACLAAALAPGALSLAAAISVLWIAIGAASSLAQATLVDHAPERRARTIARFTMLSLAGDLAAPALLVAVSGSWRLAFAIVGAALAVWTCVLATVRLPPPARTEEPPAIGVVAAVKAALADRALLGWLFATALCDLLDEILVVFASLYTSERGQLAPVTVAAFVIGGALGLAVIDRLLKRRGELQVLAGTALACAVTYAAWLVFPHPALMLAVGATAAPLYPLVSARAYAARPDASGLVLAASHVFTPLSLALPFVLGVVADHAGTWVALALLLAQPLGIFTLARRAGA